MAHLIAIDLAKNVFQLRGVDNRGTALFRKTLADSRCYFFSTGWSRRGLRWKLVRPRIIVSDGVDAPGGI
jgi:hypothetical protein